MKELVSEKTFNRDDLLKYLKSLKENSISKDVVALIESDEPSNEYSVKIFKEKHNNNDIDITLSIQEL